MQALLTDEYLDALNKQSGGFDKLNSVQQEVTRALAAPEDFKDVPRKDPEGRRKRSGRSRDTVTDDRPAWVVRDGSYVSARWPGDAHTFAKTFAAVLAGG